MWHGKTVSVALPTYNEKECIRACIEGFLETGVVEEVVVCNNNAVPGTSEEVAKTAAREVFEERQGYGWWCRKALVETTSELTVLSEPDGSFEPVDIFKLLAYSHDFEVVFGSRTNSELVWAGANMGWWMKWGNWATARHLESPFNTTALTDVGCTMRLVTRDILQRIQILFSVGESHFGPEMMLLCFWAGARAIAILLNYKQRVGKSMATGSRWAAIVIGLRMAWLITRFRAQTWLGQGPEDAEGGFSQSPSCHLTGKRI